MSKVLSLAWETILEIEHAFDDKHCQPEDILELFRRLHNDVQNIHEKLVVYINTPSWDRPTIFYNDSDDEDCTIAITLDLPTEEPEDSLRMGNEHLDTIPATRSDKFIKSSVENLIPSPSESEDLSDSECDVPACDDFTTFSNLLFDADDDFSSNILKKIYSNPLFDEEIISMKIDPHHFNAESDLIESLLNHNSSIISSSSKIDSLLDEFAGELILLKSIPPGIDKADCDPEEEIHLIEKLLYDNSSPRPPKEFISENSDAIIESFSPSPIPVEDSNPFMEEINLFLASDGSIPSGVDSEYSDSEVDNLFLERLLHDDPIPLPDTLDFSNVVRVFLPFFTYPVTSLILLSSGSEDTIFDSGISNYHFSSLESGVSHWSGTFMKFNVYLNYLNESPMEILSSTCFPRGPMNSGSSQAQDSINKNKRFSGGNPRFLNIVKTRACFQSSNHPIDSLLDEFTGELILLKSIPPGIDKADCDPEEEIHLIEKLLYDNSSPQGHYTKNSEAIIKSFSPSPIPVEDSDPFMEEIDLFLDSDGLIPSGIDSDYSDSEGDNLF
nr:hypothetical protein [Tanacetum cinerariifolium]